MRKSIFFIVLFFFIITCGAWYYSWFQPENITTPISVTVTKDSIKEHRRSTYSSRLRDFAIAKKHNAGLGFLIDMSIESGKNRFYIVDLEKDIVKDAGLVTHGRCNQNWLKGRKYSNVSGSGCTSLGIYKIGAPYLGRFGLAYKLHGLDSSNSNAFRRFAVLHSMSCVPEKETLPFPICQSDGCPAVSPAFLQKLKSLLDTSSRPVLLYIYE